MHVHDHDQSLAECDAARTDKPEIDWAAVAHNRSLRPDHPDDYEDGESGRCDVGDEVPR